MIKLITPDISITIERGKVTADHDQEFIDSLVDLYQHVGFEPNLDLAIAQHLQTWLGGEIEGDTGIESREGVVY